MLVCGDKQVLREMFQSSNYCFDTVIRTEEGGRERGRERGGGEGQRRGGGRGEGGRERGGWRVSESERKRVRGTEGGIEG